MEDYRETYEPEKTLAGFLKGIFSEDRVAEAVLRCGFTEEELKIRRIKTVLPPETGTVQISVPEGKSAPRDYTLHIVDVKLGCPPLPEGKSAPSDYTLQGTGVVMMWIELPAVEDGSHIGSLLAPKLRGIYDITVAKPFADDFPVFLPPKQTAIEAPVELVQACLNTVDDLIDQMLCDRW